MSMHHKLSGLSLSTPVMGIKVAGFSITKSPKLLAAVLIADLSIVSKG